MPTQRWKVVVAKLGASSTLHEGEVDATNWMSALRAARQAMSERPSLPPGASCTVDAQGTATVLDPSSRRKFVLSPVLDGVPPAPPAQAPAPAPPAIPVQALGTKPKRFDTVGLIPVQTAQPAARAVAAPPPVPTESRAGIHSTGMQPRQVATAPTLAEPTSLPRVHPPNHGSDASKKRFATVAFVGKEPTESRSVVVGTGGPHAERTLSAVPSTSAAFPSRPVPRPAVDLDLIFKRDEEPTPNNPLCYRERAYLLPRGTTVPEAEAALRWRLAELQQDLQPLPRGKLINLAVFDHRWRDAPQRPPVIVLEWRDWRDEVIVDYPAAARVSSIPPSAAAPHDDRLADVFEALEALPQLHSAAEGLDFAVRLLERTIPAEATSACLYDINTDELRFVAVSGSGASEMQGRAVPRASGLFGEAVRIEHHSSVFDLASTPGFDPATEGRAGLEPRNELLRPVAREHQLLGMLQLINRKGADTFTAQDVSVINYVAERLAEFLHGARLRQRSHG